MKHALTLETRNGALFSAETLQPHLDIFISKLSKKGYTTLTLENYYDSISHFATWIKNKNIPLRKVATQTLSQFSQHRCYCIVGRKGNKLSAKYIRRVNRFILYLGQEGIINIKSPLPKRITYHYLKNFKKSLECRGLSCRTIVTYEYSMLTLLPLLGDNPKEYSPNLIRKVFYDIVKKKSRCEVKKLVTALRSYLRFLSVEGMCIPDLDNVIPTVAEWKLSSLPKYISSDEVEQTIAACNIHTRQGIRDRAIILLLYRLGLRAGDVSNMRFDDINWNEGTIQVSGKGRREVKLPLPQEVGDSLLVYINNVRPLAPIDKIFLCLNAPHRPFPNSSGISSVVSAALKRAGIDNPPSHGAHLLRHSAATTMLRKGASLEAVSTMLRHQSLDMTGYYAKVDIPRLMQLAQPWLEDSQC